MSSMRVVSLSQRLLSFFLSWSSYFVIQDIETGIIEGEFRMKDFIGQ